MVKHNNRLPNPHLHKWWQRFVRVNFNQRIKQVKRRKLRSLKQKRNGGRPIEKLKPLVQCPTQRYNFKTRFGKGFSLEELKAVKLNPKAAQTIGIYIDRRRKNRCEETLQRNVERLRKYLDSLVIVPLRKKGKPKKGVAGIPADATPEAIKEAKQKLFASPEAMKAVKKSLSELPKKDESCVETIEVSKIDKDFKAYKTLRRARSKLRAKRSKANRKNRERKTGAVEAS